MRTLRMLLTMVCAAALAGATAGAVAAQSDAEDQYLTGTMTFVEELDPGTSTETEGVLETQALARSTTWRCPTLVSRGR